MKWGFQKYYYIMVTVNMEALFTKTMLLSGDISLCQRLSGSTDFMHYVIVFVIVLIVVNHLISYLFLNVMFMVFFKPFIPVS